MQRQYYNAKGENEKKEFVAYGKATETPDSGHGKAEVAKKIIYGYKEDGTFTITQMPEIKGGIGLEVTIDLAKGKNWDEGGLWWGCVSGINACRDYNIYTDGYCEAATGFDKGFTGAYAYYDYEYNGKAWHIRIDGIDDDPKYCIKLLPNLPRIVAENVENGIEFDFVQGNGSPLNLEYNDSECAFINLFIDGKKIAEIGQSECRGLKFFYPFVEPNKKITVTAEICRAEADFSNNSVKTVKITELKPLSFTPTAGCGTLEVTEEIQCTIEENGNVTLTQAPEIKLNNGGNSIDLPPDSSWSINFIFGQGNDRFNGIYLGNISMDFHELPENG